MKSYPYAFLPDLGFDVNTKSHVVWFHLVEDYGWFCVKAPTKTGSSGLAYIVPYNRPSPSYPEGDDASRRKGDWSNWLASNEKGKDWFETPDEVRDFIQNIVQARLEFPYVFAAHQRWLGVEPLSDDESLADDGCTDDSSSEWSCSPLSSKSQR